MATETTAGETAIQRFGSRMASIVERWMPSPFLFALVLSYVVFVAGVLVQGEGPVAMALHWYDGFWSLLEFAMQMVLILATGYVIAYHPWVRRVIGRLTEIPRTGAQAVVLVGVLSMVIAWVQWGLGLIAGAVLAREMGRQGHERGLNIHYPLLCIAGYMGMSLTWHWGLAGSAPLLMNTPGNVFVQEGIVNGLIPTSQTIFSTYSLALTGTAIIYGALMLYLLSPADRETEGITQFVPTSQLGGVTAADGGTEESPDEQESPSEASDGDEPTTPADRIDNSRVIGGLIALTGVAIAIYTFASEGLGALNLNVINFAFLAIGLALFTEPKAYQDQFYEAVTSTGGIILQFPFYAGIIGMMNGSGLSTTLAEALVSLSSAGTFPVVAWLTAGIINVFVPSGGGEWTVVGTTILQAAQDLGVPAGKAVTAYAVGDAHTNLLQPFWALPLLGITGMRARDIFGYGITMMILLIPFLAVALTFIPY